MHTVDQLAYCYKQFVLLVYHDMMSKHTAVKLTGVTSGLLVALPGLEGLSAPVDGKLMIHLLFLVAD